AIEAFTLTPRIAPACSEVAGLLAKAMQRKAATAESDRSGTSADAEGEGKKKEEGLTIVDLLGLLDVDADVLPAIARTCARLPPSELNDLTRTLLRGAEMNGARLFADPGQRGDQADILLRGRTTVIWRLLWVALRLNYADFSE